MPADGLPSSLKVWLYCWAPSSTRATSCSRVMRPPLFGLDDDLLELGDVVELAVHVDRILERLPLRAPAAGRPGRRWSSGSAG